MTPQMALPRHFQFPASYTINNTIIATISSQIACQGILWKKLWPSMDEVTKQVCVRQVVEIIKELAQRENNEIWRGWPIRVLDETSSSIWWIFTRDIISVLQRTQYEMRCFCITSLRYGTNEYHRWFHQRLQSWTCWLGRDRICS